MGKKIYEEKPKREPKAKYTTVSLPARNLPEAIRVFDDDQVFSKNEEAPKMMSIDFGEISKISDEDIERMQKYMKEGRVGLSMNRSSGLYLAPEPTTRWTKLAVQPVDRVVGKEQLEEMLTISIPAIQFELEKLTDWEIRISRSINETTESVHINFLLMPKSPQPMVKIGLGFNWDFFVNLEPIDRFAKVVNHSFVTRIISMIYESI